MQAFVEPAVITIESIVSQRSKSLEDLDRARDDFRGLLVGVLDDPRNVKTIGEAVKAMADDARPYPNEAA